MKYPIIALLLITLAVNCMTVLGRAPVGSKTEFLSDTDAASYKTTMHTWYLFWGLIPISNNNTAKVIQEKGLKSVRIKAYHSVVDVIVDLLLGGIVITHSVEIEGNAK